MQATLQRPINLISAYYNDRSPFVTLSDLNALQNLKVKVERDKCYAFSEITTYYNKNHNIPNTYTTATGTLIINRHNINRLGNVMGKAVKNLGISLKQDDSYNGRLIYCISLNQWETIRAEMYNIIQSKYSKKQKDYIWEQQVSGGIKKLHTKLKIFDYFFNHLKEYETDKLYEKIKVQNALYNLFDTPLPDEKNYIAHRIFKNGNVMQIFLSRIGEVFYFNRKSSDYKKDKQLRGGGRLVQASKGRIKIMKNSYTGIGFEITGRSVIILTMRQIEAILVLMEYLRDIFLGGKGGEYLEVGIKAIKKFLANQQEWEQRYQVSFTENKIYRSLWL